MHNELTNKRTELRKAGARVMDAVLAASFAPLTRPSSSRSTTCSTGSSAADGVDDRPSGRWVPQAAGAGQGEPAAATGGDVGGVQLQPSPSRSRIGVAAATKESSTVLLG